MEKRSFLCQSRQLEDTCRIWLLPLHPVCRSSLVARLVAVILNFYQLSFINSKCIFFVGKTTLVEHVAALTGRTIHNQGLLKVQLGDQTDAKVLLGTYHSTDVPGEFIWNAGVLTRVKIL